ncbi:glutathione S-transferase [Conidiobolus coronatus NRRL 28638]|uniref:Glutathione S-transferase n=1 Tax=Conidiobolus coronatus (strain ATCC 28846 / CBS 209.66 / NRRL 28638) TaxID=796925 RepID=A0A137NUU4_CONC2|nr:glutathione S-transferase [Conidiobolus coronatus NRRL 28638]|eukprot:KXN66488.1 glutathione S-transferase [Conidiobolus coronatus NRRL 28638]
MSIGKLYGPITNPRVQKCILTAEFNGVEIETTPDFKFYVDNKSEEYIAKFPMGQTPGFETSKGTLLSESAAIAFYIAQSKKDTTLLGNDAEELAKIWQLNLYAETAVVESGLDILKPKWFNLTITPEQEAKNYEALYRVLDYLEKYTAGKTYLVGDRISLTDINMMCNLRILYCHIMTNEMRTKYSNVTNYFETLLKVPQFTKVFGEIKYID